MENQRIRLTKKLLADALVQLLDQKSIEKISIQQLSIKAGVNRSTFYLHYSDIYHLLQEIEINLVEDIEQYLQITDSESTSNISDLLDYIMKNQNIFRILLTKCGASQFNEKFLEISSQIMKRNMFHSLPNVYKEYIIEYLIKANNALILKWVRDEFELSVADLTKIMKTLSKGAVNSMN